MASLYVAEQNHRHEWCRLDELFQSAAQARDGSTLTFGDIRIGSSGGRAPRRASIDTRDSDAAQVLVPPRWCKWSRLQEPHQHYTPSTQPRIPRICPKQLSLSKLRPKSVLQNQNKTMSTAARRRLMRDFKVRHPKSLHEPQQTADADLQLSTLKVKLTR